MPGRAAQALLIVVLGTALGLAIGGLPELGGDPAGTPVAVVAPPSTSTTSTTVAPATSTTVAARPPAEVRVIVYNGSGRSGLASRVSRTLTDGGWDALPPGRDLARRPVTAVWFKPGFEAEARAVAAAVGVGDDAVAAFPDPPPVPTAQEADVVVAVGADIPA